MRIHENRHPVLIHNQAKPKEHEILRKTGAKK
jgi:hypothetical protein